MHRTISTSVALALALSLSVIGLTALWAVLRTGINDLARAYGVPPMAI